MGREATITAEQVNAVADALKAEGVKPTARAVRERLGNTGSMGTVTRLLQQWRDAQQRQAASTLMLPPALQRAILEFMELELAAARATLEAELASQRQEAGRPRGRERTAGRDDRGADRADRYAPQPQRRRLKQGRAAGGGYPPG